MKILFVHHKREATFIQNDLKILRKHYDVEDFYYTPKKTLQLFKKIKECDLIYIWFISYPAYIIAQINRLFKYNKPIILVAGGYGVQPDILKKHKIFKLMSQSAIKRANKILAVSKFTKNEVIKLESWGYTYKYKTKVIYNGIDLTLFKDYKIRKGNLKPVALTVGNIFSMERYYLKGIDKFVNLAKENPHWEFYVIGMYDKIANDVVKNAPSNCHFFPPVSQENLVFYYNTANTYYQLSKYESFCLTLLEARACGCNVVTSTERTGMDEIQGIFINNLTLEKREKKLVEVLDGYRN